MLHGKHALLMTQARWDEGRRKTSPLITKYLRCPKYLGMSNVDPPSSDSDDIPLTRKAPF